MYIGIVGIETLLDEDSNYIDWFSVESINENRSEITLSNNEVFTINASIKELFDVVKNLKEYALPPADDIVFKFLAINQNNLLHVTDESITFRDDIEYKNEYENSSILIDAYQLSLEYFYVEA